MKLLKLLLAIAAFGLAGILVPKLLAEISSAEGAYGYGRATGSLALMTLAAAIGMGFLRSAFSEDLMKEGRRGSGLGTLAMLVALIVLGAGLFLRMKNPATVAEAPAVIAGSENGANVPPTRVVFASVQDAQREAVRRFPAVGVSGSAANREYIARYKRYQQERPSYFQGPDWPLRLAEEVSAAR